MGRIVKHLFEQNDKHSWQDWRWQWKNRIQNFQDLTETIGKNSFLSPQNKINTDQISLIHQFSVTPYYLSLGNPDSQTCPILLQCIPQTAELNDKLFFDSDPLHEGKSMPVSGLVHRFPDRVLWYASSICPVYCRFCMRKRILSRKNSQNLRGNYEERMEYIRKNSEIKEVIFSGGDPLLLSDSGWKKALGDLSRITTLHSIRIHTRTPVTMPMRITDKLCEIFRSFYPITVVTHFNHPEEITDDSTTAVKKLKMSGVSVLNQSVLLKNVNDRLEIMESLNLNLVRIGVIPYYLHQCDPVKGNSHFYVEPEVGLTIMRELSKRNPGISLPKYVIDLADQKGKKLVSEMITGTEK